MSITVNYFKQEATNKHFFDSKGNYWQEYEDDCGFIILHKTGGGLLKIRKENYTAYMKRLNSDCIHGYHNDGKNPTRHLSMVKPKSNLKNTINRLLREEMLENAITLADMKGYLLPLGQTFNGVLIVYIDATVYINLKNCFVGRDVHTNNWAVVHENSGFALASGHSSKKGAIDHIAHYTDEHLEKLLITVKEPTAKSQIELNQLLVEKTIKKSYDFW